MHIPAWVRECVSFVAYKGTEGMKIIGTAFHLSKVLPGVDPADPNPPMDPRAIYAVTARHNIEKAKDRSIDGQLYFRVNHFERGAEFVGIDLSEFVLHPKNVDAAALPIRFSSNIYKHRSISIENTLLTQDVIDKTEVGPGDNLFFPAYSFITRAIKRIFPS